MKSDGFDRYVGLWEMMIAAGCPSELIHAHIDGLIERLETRRDELERIVEERRAGGDDRELLELRRVIEELQASGFEQHS